jgi:hypothetical protein
VRDKIERYGLTRTIDPHHFFPTVEAAVQAYRQQTGAQWTTASQPPDGQPTAAQMVIDTSAPRRKAPAKRTDGRPDHQGRAPNRDSP